MKTPEQRAEEIDFSDLIAFGPRRDYLIRCKIAASILQHTEEATAELKKIAVELLDKWKQQMQSNFDAVDLPHPESLRKAITEWKARIEKA